MNEFDTDHEHDAAALLSTQEFAHLGGGQVAYVRELGDEQAVHVYESLPDLPQDARLFGLYAADGTCMAITDSRDAARASALENDLQPLSVH